MCGPSLPETPPSSMCLPPSRVHALPKWVLSWAVSQ